jgi:predicted enzyme related to lactoylglutathione lyase
MAHPVVHFEIHAKNGKKAQEFYAKLFDWKINVDQTLNYGLVKTGGEGGIDGGISDHGAQHGQPPFVTFYVQVDDLQASLTKAEGLGGKTVMGPTPIPGHGAMAMFQDPDGNYIGLYKG